MSFTVGAKNMAEKVATFSTLPTLDISILIVKSFKSCTQNHHRAPLPGKIQQKAEPVGHFIFQDPTVMYQAIFCICSEIALFPKIVDKG